MNVPAHAYRPHFSNKLHAFSPLGLCACWLIADVQYVHPHLGQGPDRPHDYNNLLEIFKAQALVTPPPLMPAQVWVRFTHALTMWMASIPKVR